MAPDYVSKIRFADFLTAKKSLKRIFRLCFGKKSEIFKISDFEISRFLKNLEIFRRGSSLKKSQDF